MNKLARVCGDEGGNRQDGRITNFTRASRLTLRRTNLRFGELIKKGNMTLRSDNDAKRKGNAATRLVRTQRFHLMSRSSEAQRCHYACYLEIVLFWTPASIKV